MNWAIVILASLLGGTITAVVQVYFEIFGLMNRIHELSQRIGELERRE